jgi:hypothetical protein
MIMYCMMKGWYFHSIPVDKYNSRLRILVVYLILKWDMSVDNCSISRIVAIRNCCFLLDYF